MLNKEYLKKLEVRVATLEKTLARKEMALRIASVKLAEKSAIEVYKKVAPSYKNNKTQKQVSWATAYRSKGHPNHKQALADYQKWVSKNTGKGLTKKMLGAKKKVGKLLASSGKAIGKKSWSSFKSVLKNAKGEVADMLIETPKLLGKMATGKYDFEDKEQLKKDMKTIYGSAIYYGGAVVTVMTAGAAAPLLTAKTTALSLGKSVASHAVIGSVSQSADFWGFLSLEATETVGGLAMGSEEFASTVGGYATSDLFNGLVGAIQSGLSTIASEDSESDDEDKFMVEFLGTVNEAIGKAMQEMSDEEINALS
jgi:hypothetical protein